VAVNVLTIKPAGGGDYASAQAWETAMDGKANDHQRGDCYTGGDLGMVAFANWSADAVDHPELWAAAGEANNGDPTAGCYINIGNGQQGVRSSSDNFLHVKGIRFVRTHVTADHMLYAYKGGVEGLQVEGCLFDNRATACGARAIYMYYRHTLNANFSVKIWNNLFIMGGNGPCFIVLVRSDAAIAVVLNLSFYNNTCTEGSVGFKAYEDSGDGGTATANVILRNNLCLDNGIDYSDNGALANGVVTSDHNADSDNTLVGEGWDGAGTLSNQVETDIFTDYAGDDLTLKAGSNAIDAGADLSGVGVVDDIAGLARPEGAAYDMGAFEAAVAGVVLFRRRIEGE